MLPAPSRWRSRPLPQPPVRQLCVRAWLFATSCALPTKECRASPSCSSTRCPRPPRADGTGTAGSGPRSSYGRSTASSWTGARSDLLEHMDDDELSSELLHRAQRHLAVGHGVAVDWEEAASVQEVRTTFFPRHDLPLAERQ